MLEKSIKFGYRVEDSCGTFPMVAVVADLFAAARLAEGDELVFEFPGDR